MDKTLKQIRDNWIILAFLVGVVLWYGNINNRISKVEADSLSQQTTIEKVDTKTTQIQIDVASIKATVKSINDRLK